MATLITKKTEVVEYSLSDEKDGTVFFIGAIDIDLRAYIATKAPTIGDDSDSFIQAYIEAVRFGVKGWKNMKDGNGKEVAFETEEYSVPKVGKRKGMASTQLNGLDMKWIVELGTQVLNYNFVSENDAKN